MAKLASFLTDNRAINEGQWIRVSEALYDDLEIFTRGFTDAFVDANAARTRKARLELQIGEAEPLPNALAREINASLIRDFLVLDVRNLTDDKDQPVDVQTFHAMLGQPNAARLARACWDAAAKVGQRLTAKVEADVGN